MVKMGDGGLKKCPANYLRLSESFQAIDSARAASRKGRKVPCDQQGRRKDQSAIALPSAPPGKGTQAKRKKNDKINKIYELLIISFNP